MKKIKYRFFSCEVKRGTEEEPVPEPFLLDKEIRCRDADFDANYAFAASESYDGEITVEDLPDPETEPSQEEDTAAMLVDHEYRLTLLELGLNE